MNLSITFTDTQVATFGGYVQITHTHGIAVWHFKISLNHSHYSLVWDSILTYSCDHQKICWEQSALAGWTYKGSAYDHTFSSISTVVI